MDFVSGLPRSPKGHFLSIRINYSLDQLAQLYVDEIVRLHGVPASIFHIEIQGLLLIFGVVCKRLWVLD